MCINLKHTFNDDFRKLEERPLNIHMSHVNVDKQYQWIDNIKIDKYVNFDPSIPRDSRVIFISLNGHEWAD